MLAVVVEDRYSAVFELDRVRPAVIAEGLGHHADAHAANELTPAGQLISSPTVPS